jgi:TRAP-type uncharacterized transport system substrate-binding protein
VRRALVEAHEVDSAFDEGVYNWAANVSRWGLRLLDVDGAVLTRLQDLGYRRGVITRRRYPELPSDVTTLDFSGFLVYVRADADPDLVSQVCEALAARADRIPWQGGDALHLPTLWGDTADAPLPLPLHPAAAHVWSRLAMGT